MLELESEPVKCGNKILCRNLLDRLGDQGIVRVEIVSLKKGKTSKFLICHKKNPKDQGICFNFCPFCGGDVSPETTADAKC